MEEAQKSDERIQEVLSLQREQISLAQADSAVLASMGANFAKLVAHLINSAKVGQSPSQKPAEEVSDCDFFSIAHYPSVRAHAPSSEK